MVYTIIQKIKKKYTNNYFKTPRFFLGVLSFCIMKKTLILSAFLSIGLLSAQFKVNIEAADSFSKKTAIAYTLEGAKYIPLKEANKKNGKWIIDIPKNYIGMMRVYFPENGKTVNLISENKDVAIKLTTNGDVISKIDFLDESNQKMTHMMQIQRKKTQALPALLEIKKLYNDNSAFDKALGSEIQLLENSNVATDNHPFIKYYLDNSRFAAGQENSKISTEEYIQFFANSGSMLESSSLLRPALVDFLRRTSPETIDSEVDKLLEKVNLKTSRGQLILAELLSIFEIYELEKQKEKYFGLASNLNYEVNGQLKTIVKAIKNTSIGAVLPDYSFTSNVTNTKAKKLSGVKADKKVVLFWSSTCSHCLRELPIISENYQKLKKKNIEVIAFALDSNSELYKEKTASLPWINDTELKGWQSSYTETYNVRATPTYFVLDKNDKIIEKPTNFSAFLSTLE